jgi:N-acetylglutamate synthase-like GNAT family acetyltransferase
LQGAEGNFVIDEGMLPKLKAILEALTYGVPQVHVIQAKTEALLEELFTRTGSGTLIEKEPFLVCDYPAQPEQLADILQLREECSAYTTPSGVPLLKPMSDKEVERVLPTTLVLRHREFLVGTVFFSEVSGSPDTALIGGFAVGDNHQESGYGRLLLESVLQQVAEAGFKKAISITAAKPAQYIFSQYGQEASSDWPSVVSAAKVRYGSDQDMVSLYSFSMSSF